VGQLVVVLFIGFVILIFVQLLLIPGPVWLACRLLPKWYRDLGSVYYCWELQTTTAGRDWSISGGGFRQPLKCCDSITATSNKPQA